jgi:Arylsulfotransferase (ASST)
MIRSKPTSGRRRRPRVSLSLLHKALLFGALLIVLGSVMTLSIASRRIEAEQAAFGAPPTVPRCEPQSFNVSDVLPGTRIAVSPLPDSYDSSPYTQISIVGVPRQSIASISVTGSSSGSHSGSLRAYSQGDGASFLPTRQFSPGETVWVKAKLRVPPHSFAFHFVVSHPDYGLYKAILTKPKEDLSEMQHFQSAPNITPPMLEVTVKNEGTAPGDLFSAPYAGPGASGPMIFDEAGNLVWFHPLPWQLDATNLQVQQYGPSQVLTWWQGSVTPQGFGQGEEVIVNHSYQQIGRIHAGNGYDADLHDFHITDRGTALFTVFEPIECDLSSVGGPHHGAVTNTAIQEVDIATGLVRREWTSIDHVGINESYSSATGSSVEWPFDYFHLNSIDELPNGRTLISARNTWAMYEMNTLTGQLINNIGGKHTTVKLTSGAATAFQHDASSLGNGLISVFDNGAVPVVHPQSRALLLSINPQTDTESVIGQYEHPKPLSSGSQGDVQSQADGNLFVGWGAQPYFSEFNSAGQLLYDAHWHGSYQSYRSYRFQWTGVPPHPPALTVTAPSPNTLTAYVSWNGDNRTATWRLLGGSSPTSLAPVATVPKSGFETTIPLSSQPAYVAVQALDANGNLLSQSVAVKG